MEYADMTREKLERALSDSRRDQATIETAIADLDRKKMGMRYGRRFRLRKGAIGPTSHKWRCICISDDSFVLWDPKEKSLDIVCFGTERGDSYVFTDRLGKDISIPDPTPS